MQGYPHHKSIVALALIACLGSLPRTTDAGRGAVSFQGTVIPHGHIALSPSTGVITHFGDEAGIRLSVLNGTNSAQSIQLEAQTMHGSPWKAYLPAGPFAVLPAGGINLIAVIPHTTAHPDQVRICVVRPLVSTARRVCGRYTLKRLNETLPIT